MSEDGFAPRFIRRVPPNMSPERAARLAEIDEIFSRDSVYRLTGIGMKRTRALRRAGYPTIESVAAATPAAIAAALGSVRLAKDIHMRARAKVDGGVLLLKPRPLPRQWVVVDVETSTDRQDDPWLVGFRFPDGNTLQLEELDVTRHPEHLKRVDDVIQQWWWDHMLVQWSGFDRAALEKAWTRNGLPPPEWLDRSRWFDAWSWTRAALAVPSGGFGLKEFAASSGFEWRHPDLDGRRVGVWYERYRDEGQHFDVDRVREYNEDDVLGTAHAIENVIDTLAQKGFQAEYFDCWVDVDEDEEASEVAPMEPIVPLHPSFIPRSLWRDEAARNWWRTSDEALQLRRRVRARDAFTCQYCGFVGGPDRPQFEIHVDHCDGDHNNNDLENLRAVCCWCHAIRHAGHSSAVEGFVWLFEESPVGQVEVIRETRRLRSAGYADEAIIDAIGLRRRVEFREDLQVLKGLVGFVTSQPGKRENRARGLLTLS